MQQQQADETDPLVKKDKDMDQNKDKDDGTATSDQCRP